MLVPDPERPGERRVKVRDFGIAKLSQQMSSPNGKVQTERSFPMTTPDHYLPPRLC